RDHGAPLQFGSEPPCSPGIECPILYKDSRPVARVSSGERPAQAQVLLRVEGFRAQAAVEAQLGELVIDLRLGAAAGREAGEGAAEVLAAADGDVARGVAEEG